VGLWNKELKYRSNPEKNGGRTGNGGSAGIHNAGNRREPNEKQRSQKKKKVVTGCKKQGERSPVREIGNLRNRSQRSSAARSELKKDGIAQDYGEAGGKEVNDVAPRRDYPYLGRLQNSSRVNRSKWRRAHRQGVQKRVHSTKPSGVTAVESQPEKNA